MVHAASSPGTLTVNDLAVSRGSNRLIDGLSISIAPGDIVWVSGHNGSGKTSLLKSLAGLIRPDSGQISWIPTDANTHRNHIAFQGHNDGHKPNLTVAENLEFWRDVLGTELDTDVILNNVELTDLKTLKAKNLSAGQSRRLAFARLLVSDAPLWILDEPTAALDKSGRDLLYRLLEHHLAKSGSAILASHAKPGRIGKNARHLTLKASEYVDG
jgi:heme exporter protein A